MIANDGGNALLQPRVAGVNVLALCLFTVGKGQRVTFFAPFVHLGIGAQNLAKAAQTLGIKAELIAIKIVEAGLDTGQVVKVLQQFFKR